MKATYIPAYILTVLIILSSVFLSGCTASESEKISTQHNFDQTITLPEAHYNPDGSCYYTSTIDVKNSGPGQALNVMVRCSLKDPDTGDILDTESRFFEVIDEGDHKAFSVSLNGDCGKNYGVGVSITEDYK